MPTGAAKGQPSLRNTNASSDAADFVKIVEKGDELYFERKAPFGVQKWSRKKSELNDFERQAWEKQQNK
jgi:hypothetical protein